MKILDLKTALEQLVAAVKENGRIGPAVDNAVETLRVLDSGRASGAMNCSEAFNSWWSGVATLGDPARRPNLVTEAFAAGWNRRMNYMTALCSQGALVYGEPKEIVAIRERLNAATPPDPRGDSDPWKLEEPVDQVRLAHLVTLAAGMLSANSALSNPEAIEEAGEILEGLEKIARG